MAEEEKGLLVRWTGEDYRRWLRFLQKVERFLSGLHAFLEFVEEGIEILDKEGAKSWAIEVKELYDLTCRTLRQFGVEPEDG